MKAVIVDLVNEQAAALCDDGRVVKLADPGYSLGQIVEVHERKRRTPLWIRYASTAAAAALLLAGAGGGAAYAMPYGVVSLDVNPSLEYTINRFDYVIKVEGVNEDGKELLAEMNTKQLVHRRIGDALEASMQQLEERELLVDQSDEIVISAGAKRPDHAERLVSTLENDRILAREGLEVHAFVVSEEDINAAHKEGMSAGRHRMLHELRESEGEDFVPDEWAERPIHDIVTRLENGPEAAADREDAHSTPPEMRGDANVRPAMDKAEDQPDRADVQTRDEQTRDEQTREDRQDEQARRDFGENRPGPGGDIPRQDSGSPENMAIPAFGGGHEPGGFQGSGGGSPGGPAPR